MADSDRLSQLSDNYKRTLKKKNKSSRRKLKHNVLKKSRINPTTEEKNININEKTELKEIGERSHSGQLQSIHPPKILCKQPSLSHENCESEIYGPAPPPHLSKSASSTAHIPASPPFSVCFLQEREIENTSQSTELKEDIKTIIGPLPQTESYPLTSAEIQLEERALQLKLQTFDSDKTNKEKFPAREDWMIKLPELNNLKNLQPSNRKFRTKPDADLTDRSCWTDTPKSKVGNIQTKNLFSELYVKERDSEQERLAQKGAKERKSNKTLLEIHRKKLKKQKKESNSNQDRRPFSREIDLHGNRLNKEQTNSVIRKAQILNDKFKSGKVKYL